MFLAHKELNRIAKQFCDDAGVAEPTGVNVYFSEEEIDTIVLSIMPRLESYAGVWHMLEKPRVPDQESYDKAVHCGLYSDATFRRLREMPDRQGRRLPTYKSDDQICAPDDEVTKTDQQSVQAAKYQARRALRRKIKVSLKQFLDAPQESPLSNRVRILLEADLRELRSLACPNRAHEHELVEIALVLERLYENIRSELREMRERGESLT